MIRHFGLISASLIYSLSCLKCLLKYIIISPKQSAKCRRFGFQSLSYLLEEIFTYFVFMTTIVTFEVAQAYEYFKVTSSLKN